MKDIERMVISAYGDGEVEAPWKQQVERKILEDPAWAAEAALQNRLHEVLAGAPEPDFAEAGERVFRRVAGSSRPVARLLPSPMAWIPVAAALLVLAASGGYWWGRSSADGPVEVAELQVQVPKQLELQLSGEGQLLMASTLEGTRR